MCNWKYVYFIVIGYKIIKKAYTSINNEYADDSVLFFSHKNVDVINDQLNRDFNSLCDWFVDNKLSIHFGQLVY